VNRMNLINPVMT